MFFCFAYECLLGLQKHCNWDERQDSFVFPEKEILMKYTVLVATMVTAGRLEPSVAYTVMIAL